MNGYIKEYKYDIQNKNYTDYHILKYLFVAVTHSYCYLYVIHYNDTSDLYSPRQKCSYKAHTINYTICYKNVMTNCIVFAHKKHIKDTDNSDILEQYLNQSLISLQESKSSVSGQNVVT